MYICVCVCMCIYICIYAEGNYHKGEGGRPGGIEVFGSRAGSGLVSEKIEAKRRQRQFNEEGQDDEVVCYGDDFLRQGVGS